MKRVRRRVGMKQLREEHLQTVYYYPVKAFFWTFPVFWSFSLFLKLAINIVSSFLLPFFKTWFQILTLTMPVLPESWSSKRTFYSMLLVCWWSAFHSVWGWGYVTVCLCLWMWICRHADVNASFGTRFVYGRCVQNDNCDKEFIKHFGSIYAGVKTFMIVTH